MSGGPVPVWKKYTTQSRGIWEIIRKIFVLVPNRSTGNPLVAHFRQIPPGARIDEANNYQDPGTVPAADIKGNQYYNRDFRRNYPQVVGFNQTKVSGLLQLGSSSNPRISIGDKGTQELSTFIDPAAEVSLSTTLASVPSSVVKGEILGKNGEPIVAPSLNKFKWKILAEPVHGMYPERYPCRIFTDEKVGTSA
ncbi:NADH-ubiquinone oxidoreductase subunit [Spathaspora passalidarum NRRL Y-27907]|uniref:NADH-ubiquinone oxidoreductase subunit n=1 Tax=Spathaspora passalidarum (strain NRRL Y-27907 / 11-Y1) TaxID=619300 RepID=G3AQH2_SPAPN|nr:NADH-ubiquinone oxidoreductase subunit [Spathaspora passalidarum NRRL Y-27907]EGW31519.1 NADH-ubiquinone oxidoreductase subunit [Spathaspora passalidarum NRRL Y-27907]